ncbi:hypothetical protein LPJ66_007211 [Kickxella alabastrina]|uniref:Uncharacterized protein n=1 Tax=Kickxella alabastrina TaxID=61397 RepID=A0ACC1I9Q7_9FUNG|nr:hypothetical protein LPJ66_007211 [Kickxella alabastrina]
MALITLILAEDYCRQVIDKVKSGEAFNECMCNNIVSRLQITLESIRNDSGGRYEMARQLSAVFPTQWERYGYDDPTTCSIEKSFNNSIRVVAENGVDRDSHSIDNEGVKGTDEQANADYLIQPITNEDYEYADVTNSTADICVDDTPVELMTDSQAVKL